MATIPHERRRGNRRSPIPIWRRPAALVAYGSLSGLLVVFLFRSLNPDRPSITSDPLAAQLAAQSTRLAAASAEIERLRRELAALAANPDRTSLGAQVARLDTVSSDLRARQARLEAAIMADPAKALQVPLLHRDVESLRISQTQQIDALREEMDRIIAIMQWIVGGLSGAIFSLLVAFGWGAFGKRSPGES